MEHIYLSSKNLLIVGSVLSFLIALLHIALAIRPKLYEYFGASKLSELTEQGSSFTIWVTLGLVIMFVVWGFYGLSGAGIIRQLPLMRITLIGIAIIYLLRALMLPSDIMKFVQHARPFRFIILSIGSLLTGLLYLIGTIGAAK
ncbi:hypothetical protein [Aquimarina sp. 2304DJ70-9]|uniref:hypothetical protein n=1 Tax=Aquimarina penaris TaxID=3231044 RepID=UPI003461B4C9